MAASSLKRLASNDRDISPPAKRKVPATTTAKSVANFFRPTSDKVVEAKAVTFQIVHDSVLTAKYQNASPVKPSIAALDDPLKKIAAFDFDDTIITTSSGNRFAKDAQDWKWWHASVPDKLIQLHQQGYVVVIISNQAAVKLQADSKTMNGDMKSLNTFKGKVTSVLTRLALPISVFAATKHDIYRKPRTGMWQLVLDSIGCKEDEIDRGKSIFVGDAAGRIGDKSKGVRTDHSSSDRDLASNIGIPFATPEEYFLGEAERPFQRRFDPSVYLEAPSASAAGFTKKHDLDIVLFCGSPGAGKSTFYWTHLQPLGYNRANQDILKTRERCMQAVTNSIQDGKSIAVDNTNADRSTREHWVNLARKLKVPIRLVHFTASTQLCEHNNTVRALNPSMNPESRTLLPKLAFTSFAARRENPSVREGFEDITPIDFSFRGTDEEKAVWSRYWVS